MGLGAFNWTFQILIVLREHKIVGGKQKINQLDSVGAFIYVWRGIFENEPPLLDQMLLNLGEPKGWGGWDQHLFSSRK
jgi:hypothetical protein